MTSYDAVIVGHGPAGSVAALILARVGRKVLLIGPQEKHIRKIGETLPGAGRGLLRYLGLLNIVENEKHVTSYGNCSAWGSSQLESLDFINDPRGLGWHLDRSQFDQDLRLAAIAAGSESKYAVVKQVSRTENGWILKIDNMEIETRFLGEATGRTGVIARQLGISSVHDDRLMSVHTWLPSMLDDMRTLIESSPDGWWYCARLPDSTRVIAFHTDFEFSSQCLKDPAVWLNQLEQTVHMRKAVKIETELQLSARPAFGSTLGQWADTGWIAMGDAALAFDPLSSQGIFNALYTGMKAGEAIHATLDGQPDALKKYSDGLHKIRKAYLRHHLDYYAAETRWTDRPFWKNRQPPIS